MREGVFNIEILDDVFTDEWRSPVWCVDSSSRRRRRKRHRQLVPLVVSEVGITPATREVIEREGVALGDDVEPIVDGLFMPAGSVEILNG